ncbi:HPP family protein [Haladaptatus halobius]|uniref:HPP family protein n=1 Tax=Haladaptatus halobius TaxID=2884875 RepID=UPI001D0BD1D9|nr:HPP family protein [Haladaptatus halobius]
MLERLRTQYERIHQRLRRVERRELREFRRWVEHTGNLIHLSVLLFVPLLIGMVTLLSNTIEQLSFLLFPPLAAGTYTLFADPQGRYASPRKFVGGLTVGALCGWAALELAAYLFYQTPPGESQISAGGAAMGVLFTAISTWAFDLEEPSAFSTALLVLVTGTSQLAYVLSVAVSSGLVAAVFVSWRRLFYERRAHYLYQSTRGDDNILVPMRGEQAETTAMFAARLAAAHEAGKVVLLDIVSDETIEDVEQEVRLEQSISPRLIGAEQNTTSEVTTAAEERITDQIVTRLKDLETHIENTVDIPCELVVAVDGTATANIALQTARETNCDLIVTPYEEDAGKFSPFIRMLFGGDIDVIAFRPTTKRTHWSRVLVLVRNSGDVAHRMLDFAQRLVGETGRVNVCTCISRGTMRRSAEHMLANLVETFSGPFDTHISRSSVEEFLSHNSSLYDLAIVGASTDRSTASRFISPPTFEKIQDIDCDLAIVHRH